MNPGLRLFQRVIETGRIDADTELHLVRALRLFHADPAADGSMLLRYMGLPTTATKVRQAARDYWLCEASALLGGGTVSQRVRLLHDAIRRFEGRIWPRWKNFSSAPVDADEVSGCLYLARRSGELPGICQLRNILS